MNYKNKKRKIGLVLSKPPAYSETFLISKIEGLQASGFEVILFVNKDSSKFELCKVYKSYANYRNNFLSKIWSLIIVILKLIRIPKRVIKFIRLEQKSGRNTIQILKNSYTCAHILSHNLDWLHFGYATLTLNKENISKSINAKMAVSFRGYDINVYPLKFKGCYDLLWKRLDKVHSISNFLIKRASQFGMPNNLDIKIITPAVAPSFFEVPLNMKPSKKIKIVTVARFNWIKGLDIAIQTMYLLKKSGVEFEYHIIGSGSESECERYKFQVIERQLENDVFFHGRLIHIETKELLLNSTIYLQPSLSEGFCNAVLEAQALGLLCVVSDRGALSENVIHEKTGWIVFKTNPFGFEKAIKEVISLSENKKNTIRVDAKSRVASEFNIKKQQQEFVEFYAK